MILVTLLYAGFFLKCYHENLSILYCSLKMFYHFYLESVHPTVFIYRIQTHYQHLLAFGYFSVTITMLPVILPFAVEDLSVEMVLHCQSTWTPHFLDLFIKTYSIIFAAYHVLHKMRPLPVTKETES